MNLNTFVSKSKEKTESIDGPSPKKMFESYINSPNESNDSIKSNRSHASSIKDDIPVSKNFIN